MRTGNPALNDEVFRRATLFEASPADVMTLSGAVAKTALLLVVLVAAASITWGWTLGANAGSPALPVLVWGGALVGFLLALVTAFKATWSPLTAPLYAACEGLFLGGVSAIYEAQFHGLVFQAVGLTVGILAVLLGTYASGLVKPSENFKLGVVAVTGGVALVYLLSMGMRLLGVQVPFIHDSGLIGIGFSLFVVVLASLNLVLDFDFIENGVEQGAPKYMEWYAAFGLLVTLVWLYIEILRLLAKLRSRD